ncbi:MAG: tetratricopeptide repeat protein [Bacteroidales bacterium]|nr:tetratricopeptide repeat protein [Bacteroidales bacterium]MBN2697882.1 tetratricopeptide repeat protein [Bacteroidales bacterium]
MAKKKSAPQSDKSLEGIESALTRSEQFIEDNQKILTYILAGILLVVLAIIGGNRYYFKPKNAEASANMYIAERYFEIDSFSRALYGYGTYPGFLQIIDDYGITRSARLAKYYSGICFHNLGQHQEAVEYLSEFKTRDILVGAAKFSTLGDAYAELQDYNSAIKMYKKGIQKFGNSFSSPILLKKLGILYEETDELDNALNTYREIEKRYSESPEGREIKKYIGRVEAKLTL